MMHMKATASEAHIAKVSEIKKCLKRSLPDHNGKSLASGITAVTSWQSKSSSKGNCREEDCH
jgi:hypothetical protein